MVEQLSQIDLGNLRALSKVPSIDVFRYLRRELAKHKL